MIEFFENIFVSSDDNLTPWKELEQRIPTLEELKMASLYSDMFQNDFFDPEEIITFNLAKSTLELTGHRIEFINTISPPDNILRLAKKEDILAYRAEGKTFEPFMSLQDREKKIAGWKAAVSSARGWAKEIK